MSAADDAELLFTLDTGPLLPSTVELRNQLVAATAEREALEASLQSLQNDERTAREAIKDLTQRACIVLATARLELRRKDAQLAELGVTPGGSSAAAT